MLVFILFKETPLLLFYTKEKISYYSFSLHSGEQYIQGEKPTFMGCLCMCLCAHAHVCIACMCLYRDLTLMKDRSSLVTMASPHVCC